MTHQQKAKSTAATHDLVADRLVVAAIRLTRTLRAVSRGGTLTGPEVSALAIAVYSKRIKARDLCALEEVSPPAISKLVASMEAKGLVKRTRDSADARVQWISATARGSRLVAQGHARRIAPLASAIARLSGKELRVLREAIAIIERLAGAAREHKPQA